MPADEQDESLAAMPRADEDGPWKQALTTFFPDFVALLFPAIHALIDWSVPFEFLDTELQKITPASEVGVRRVDMLARVTLRSGAPAWVMFHVEVQSEPERGFPKRMYVYNYRAFDLHEVEVISAAVLTDADPNWRPERFEYELGGCRVELTFPMVKLLDFESRREELEASENPFAVVVLAQLEARATAHDAGRRYAGKVRMVRRLYDRGLDRERVVELFRLIDWLMGLPKELERGFREEVERLEETMPYITSIERLAKEEGLEQGLERGLEQGLEQGLERGRILAVRESVIDNLETRFGPVPDLLRDAIRRIEDLERLRELRRTSIQVASLSAFTEMLSPGASRAAGDSHR